MPGILVFLSSFGICLALMAPGLTFGDSGELAAAAWTTGVAHPPGYPGWMILARIFTLLPFGGVVFRTNLFSGVCAAGSAALVTSTVSRAGAGRFVSMACGLGLLLNSSILRFATVTEVYTLNLLFFSLFFWIAGRFRGPGALALVSGLAIANHTTALALIPPWLVIAFCARRMKSAVFAFLAGALLILAMPAASLKDPAMNWGRPTTLSRFAHTVTRAQYGEAAKDPRTFSSFFVSCRAFGMDFVWPWLVFPAGLVLVTAGVLAMKDPAGTASSIRNLISCRPGSELQLVILWTGVVFSGGLLFITNPGDTGLMRVVEPFFMPFVLSCWTAAGLATAGWKNRPAFLRVSLFAGVLICAAVVLPSADRKWDFTAPRFCRDIITSLNGGFGWTADYWSTRGRAGILLITDHDDNFFPLVHARACVSEFPGFLTICRQFLSLSWYFDELKERHPDLIMTDFEIPLRDVKAISERRVRDILVSNSASRESWFILNYPPNLGTGFTILPTGLLFRALPGRPGLFEVNKALNLSVGELSNSRGWPREMSGGGADGDTVEAMRYYCLAAINLGVFAMEQEEIERAARFFAEALELAVPGRADDAARAAAGLGKALLALRDYTGALKALCKADSFMAEAAGVSGAKQDKRIPDRDRRIPDRGETRYQRGLALMGLGRNDEAARAVKEAMDLGRDPDPEVAGRLGISPGLRN